MTAPSDHKRVVSSPLSVRLILASSSIVLGLLITLLGGAAFESLIALVIGLAGTTVACLRSLRLSLLADTEEIVIRNLFRTHLLKWADISHVGIGITSLAGAQVSAVVFRRRDETGVVAAQATAKGERECRRVIRELAQMRSDLPIQFSD